MHITVKDIMHKPTTVDAEMKISDAVKIMDKKEIGSVLVAEHGKTVGILTERDILKRVVAKGLDPWYTQAKQVMSTPLITVDCFTDVKTASEIMHKKNVRRLIVLEGNDIIGIITTRSIVNALTAPEVFIP